MLQITFEILIQTIITLGINFILYWWKNRDNKLVRLLEKDKKEKAQEYVKNNNWKKDFYSDWKTVSVLKKIATILEDGKVNATIHRFAHSSNINLLYDVLDYGEDIKELSTKDFKEKIIKYVKDT